jgi:hypothetical protein
MDDLYPHERGVGEAWDYLINDMGIDNPDELLSFKTRRMAALSGSSLNRRGV